MRRLYIGALVGVMTLAVAAVALGSSGQAGSTTQNFDMKFAVPGSGGTVREIQKPKRSTGIAVDLSSSDASNPKNQQPSALRRLDLDLPAQTKIDPSAVPFCKASDTDLQNEGPSACPRSTNVGSGSATAKWPFANNPQTGAPLNDVQVKVTAFNRRGGLLLYFEPDVSVPFTIRATWVGKLSNGPVLRTNVPPNCVPPATEVNGSCQNTSTGAPGDEVILNSFKLTTKARSKTVTVRRNGKRRRITKRLITTPAKCPNGGWEFMGKFTFQNGQTLQLQDQDNCTP